MAFDWSKVKAMKRSEPVHEPPVSAFRPSSSNRFDFTSDDLVANTPSGLTLLEFVTWCVPDADKGPIADLYDFVPVFDGASSSFVVR